jgi:hypothetical protein
LIHFYKRSHNKKWVDQDFRHAVTVVDVEVVAAAVAVAEGSLHVEVELEAVGVVVVAVDSEAAVEVAVEEEAVVDVAEEEVEWGEAKKSSLSHIVTKVCLFQRERRMRYVLRTWCLGRLFTERSALQQRTRLESWNTESGILSAAS